jgi:hypothetical protein
LAFGFGVAEHPGAAAFFDGVLEEGEHELGGAGDMGSDGWEAVFAGLFGRGRLRGERHPVGPYTVTVSGAFVADHFGVDAVTARVGQHLQEAGDPTGFTGCCQLNSRRCWAGRGRAYEANAL